MTSLFANRLSACLLGPALIFTSVSASAQNVHDVVPGRSFNENVVIQTSGDTLRFRADAGSCYCCEIVTAAGSNGFFSNPVRVSPNIFESPVPITARFAGGDNPQVGADSSRLCFTVPANIPFPSVEIAIGASGSLPVSAKIRCDETTLFSNFNTSVTDFNFLEMVNTLDKGTTGTFTPRDLTVTITALNTIPAVDVTVIDNLSTTVPAGSRTDVDIHSAARSGVFGPVKICHNGAPGSIKAVVSQYNITSESPLDFAPVAQDIAKTRSEIGGVSR